MIDLPAFLVVDDRALMRRIICGMLEQIGYFNFDEASDGRAALSLINSRPYHVIVSDWNMDPMDGLALLQAIRKSESLKIKRTPFVMASAMSDIISKTTAINAGATSYLVKPFAAHELKLVLDQILRMPSLAVAC